MKNTQLNGGQISDFIPIGQDGQPVYLNAEAFRSALAINPQVGPELVKSLAIPRISADGLNIDWYVPFPPQSPTGQYDIVAWPSATPQEQQAARNRLHQFEQAVKRLGADLMRRGGDNKSMLFAHYLTGVNAVQNLPAIHFPSPEFVYLVDGIPVITFWGFCSKTDDLQQSPFAPLAATATAAAAGAAGFAAGAAGFAAAPHTATAADDLPPLPPQQQQPVESNRHRCIIPWWLWLLLLLLLLGLLLWWLLPRFFGGSVLTFDSSLDTPVITAPATAVNGEKAPIVDEGVLADPNSPAHDHGRLLADVPDDVTAVQDTTTAEEAQAILEPSSSHELQGLTSFADNMSANDASSSSSSNSADSASAFSDRNSSSSAWSNESHVSDSNTATTTTHTVIVPVETVNGAVPTGDSAVIPLDAAGNPLPSTGADSTIPMSIITPPAEMNVDGALATDGALASDGALGVDSSMAMDNALATESSMASDVASTSTNTTESAEAFNQALSSDATSSTTTSQDIMSTNGSPLPPDPLAGLTPQQQQQVLNARQAEQAALGQGAPASTPNAPATTAAATPAPNELSFTPQALQNQGQQVLNGTWSTRSGLMDSANGRPLQMSYQFNNGQGQVVINRPDGVKCVAPVTAAVSNGRVVLRNTGHAQCPDNTAYQLPEVTCQPSANGKVVCSGAYGNQIFPIQFLQQ